MKDPYYQKILAGLAGPLDRDAFEECAVALLGDAYPGLAVIHGGSDAGMDGAIADGEGEAYPLVATTEEDVARNLRKNLGSHERSGKQRRLAVLATSRRVTPPMRRRLEKLAQEECGFILVNVHDRFDLAARLYRSSRWTRDLLGVTGDPPALSAVPRTRRPFPEIELVGRDADLGWLHETSRHRMVVGQPGSGKTALLAQLVREGKALFLSSDDETKIAEAYRDSRPALILADDAHLDPERLVRLRQIRADIDADFGIVASTWPGVEDDIAEALGIGSSSIRRLELLTRAEILQVLRSVGVAEPDDDPYLRLLVDQSANKPGLAVTLGSLWLRGEGRDVVSGKALQRSLIPALKRVLEHDPTQLLACFALGGNAGLSMEAVAEFLDKGRGEVHQMATRASQGGVLSVRRDGLLSVEPEALRSALLREVFFSPPSPPYRQLLNRALDRGEAIETLVIAAARGVEVPRDEIRELLLEGGSDHAWQVFAILGEDEGRWVLENFPGSISKVSTQVLQRAPRPTIQRLFREAEGTDRPLHSHPSLPLSLLQDWVQDIPDPRHYSDHIGEMLRRRKVLIEEARKYLQREGDQTVGLRACFVALSPRLRSSADSATGGTVTLRQGVLHLSSIPQVLELWAEVREDLGEITREIWSELESALQGWVWPNTLGPRLTEEESNQYREVARQIVSDLGDRAQGSPGLSLGLKKWADLIGLPIAIDQAKDFEVLFPLRIQLTTENWRREEEKQVQAAQALAARWRSRRQQEVSRQLASYSAEARRFGHQGSKAIWTFFRALASEVDAPKEWLSAFIDEQLPAGWLGPMFERVVWEQHSGWERILEFCLESDDYAWLAADLAIRSERIPQRLLDVALARLPANLVETACLRRQVPLDTLRCLLEHRNEETAVAAAVGEWLCDPEGEVRPQIQTEWRRAILRVGSAGGAELSLRSSTYWLRSILGKDSDLAITWLEARLESAAGYDPVESDGLYAAAIKPLATNQRKKVIRQLTDSLFAGQIIPLLVGESAELYRCLLSQDHLRRHHLAPLAGRPPDNAWAELARLALEAGHDPRAVAASAFGNGGGYSGFGVRHWTQWETGFRRLLETTQGSLQEVARYGLESAQAEISKAKEERRRFELTGEL